MRYISYCFSTLLLLVIFSSCGSESTPVYNLTTTPTPDEAGAISPSSGEYDEGESVEITATPNADWVFDGWEGDASGSDNPTTVTMDADKDIAAVFVVREYPLTIETEGEGTVHEQVMKQKTSEYEHGTVVQLTAEADEGWEFSYWEGDLESENEVEEIDINEGKTVIAVFERIEYSLTVSKEGGGDVSEEVVQTKSTDYPYETTVELTANPDEGWSFSHWEQDLTGEENPSTIEIDEAKEVTAVFEEIFYLHENEVTIICASADVGEKGTVEGLEYEAVDRNLLIERRDKDADLTKVCTSLVTNMSFMFSDSQFDQDINSWDVSNVINMSFMFRSSGFDRPISDWDVGSVTDMRGMFSGSDFDQNINDWDVSNVTDMSSMFGGSDFDQNISDWDVSNVTDMSRMFHNSYFNQDISAWDVSNVTDMNWMFVNASFFNQDIGDWDVSSVTDTSWMFFGASSFNQDIRGWNVSSVTDMNRMFVNTDFDQDISAWDVSNVTDMSSMLARSDFNQDISDWNVSSVRDMSGMFSNTPFNQDISDWNVSGVRDMSSMFTNTPFNHDISDWDVSSIRDMSSMFNRAESFNQDIGNWDVDNVRDMSNMFNRAETFNKDISGWCVENISEEPDRFSDSSPLIEDYHPVWGTCPD